ncbi:CACNA1S [Symbiodinium necroappetens]|uniref:CACNA1S protein n=1 Tax=Symbiodinium necroappetens TaxID=1628268 RepID=A0A812SH68_9DINO|nr:CACNA1S [Symbiodinium necroappetens]
MRRITSQVALLLSALTLLGCMRPFGRPFSGIWLRTSSLPASWRRPSRVIRMASTGPSVRMSDEEKFFFDLNGFLHVRGALSKDVIDRMNQAITAHSSEIKEREDGDLRNTRSGSALSGDGHTGRRDLGGMLGWPKPHCQPFREVLAHPKLLPYLVELCGAGYRMDHLPLVITSQKGSEGFHLHGGPLTQDGAFNPTLQYRCVNGQFYNSLLGMSVQLVDHGPGDGGFCVIRGSHKSNFPVPDDFLHGGGEEAKAHFYQPETRAGDVVFFSEATVHGAMAWTAEHERRIALYRFAPATVAYGRSYAPQWPQEMLEDLTPAQRAVLEPPYAGAAREEQERPASPAKAGRSDPEALLAERLASVWIRLQDKLEAQCSELCTSAKRRDDDLVQRLDERLNNQTSIWQESVRNLESVVEAQRAQWQSIVKEVRQHPVAQPEPSAPDAEHMYGACTAPARPSVKIAEGVEQSEQTLNGSPANKLVARATWHEAPPPVTEQPASIPGSVAEVNGTMGDGHTSPKRRNNSTVSFQSQKSEGDPDFESKEERKAYEHAVAKAERMLILRAASHGRIQPREKDWREQLQIALESWWGEGLCALVIFTNCIVIGVETDVVAQSSADKSPEVFSVLDTLYTLVFFAELLVRLSAYGGDFFWGPKGLFWNYLDVIIVCPSMVQLAIRVIWQSDDDNGGGSLTVVRVLRITRVFRVIRVVKVMKFVRSLRQLVESIMHTMKSLAWSMLLLVAIIYVFAIMFTDASIAHMADNPTSVLNPELSQSWGTLHASMHTLFRAVSGGFDWGGTAAALGDVHWAWMYLFTAYIAFCMFAVLNVMTGIFCQVAVESSRNDPQFLMQHLLAEKDRQTDLIRNLFRIFDRERRGYIALTELEDKFNDETAQGMMGLLEIYPESSWSLFKKLDENADGRLNEDEFVNGIFKLKGVTKSWDVEEILQDVWHAYGRRMQSQ